MNACSYSRRTFSLMLRRTGSAASCSGPPPRSSSQLGPQVTSVGRPSMRERGGARGQVVAERGGGEVLVVVRPGLVVVVQRGQFGVGEQPGEAAGPAAGARHEPAVLELPAALPLVLVLVAAGVALARAGLDVVEPDVLGAGAVGPGLFAGDRAGVAADALVEVHDHGDLCHDPSGTGAWQMCLGACQYSTFWARRRIVGDRVPLVSGRDRSSWGRTTTGRIRR